MPVSGDTLTMMTDRPHIPSSRIPGFYNLSLTERQQALLGASGLSTEELKALSGEQGLSMEQADHMIENVVGEFALPLGIALNFVVNGLT